MLQTCCKITRQVTNNQALTILFFELKTIASDFHTAQQFPTRSGEEALAQIGNSAATGLYGNNTNLAASFFVQNGGSILVCGEWFSPGNVSLLWDGVTGLGTILTNETGFFNTTVLVPTTTAGQHTLVIRDNCSDFCFNLTRLPTVSNDYMDLWHTSDFTINLTPDYSVNETFYTINNGTACNVTANGQPTITTEGNSNTLEYWSTWNVNGTSTMELAHVTLTGIKLDKTAPAGSITINGNYVNTATVTLALSAADSNSGIAQMRFSNDNNEWSIWEQYATSKTWTLQNGDGTKTVYYQIKDNAGLLSSPYSNTIILDTSPPTGSILINNGAVYTNTTIVNIALSATDASSGVAKMRFSSDNITWSDWETYTSSKTWSLQNGDGTKTVTVQYKDNAGLISTYNCTTILDTTKPIANAGQNKNVNSGATVTFDAGGSSDESGIVSYLWDFGDGSVGSGMTTTHTYSNAGTYAARITIQDPAGNTATATVTIVVQTPQPTPTPSPSPTIKPTPVTSPSPTPNSPSPTPSSTPEVSEYPLFIVLFFMLTALVIAMFTKKEPTEIRK